MRGYFDGLSARMARKGVGAMFAWTFYEVLTDKIKDQD